MSQLAKTALIIITLNLFLYVAFPNVQLGASVVHELLSTNNNIIQPGSKFNSTLSNTTKSENGIIAGVLSMPDYVKKAMAFFLIVAGIFTSPFTVGNYLIGLGIPIQVMLIYVGIISGVYMLAVMDWIRSGE